MGYFKNTSINIYMYPIIIFGIDSQFLLHECTKEICAGRDYKLIDHTFSDVS
jgi:hypothetical protein